MSESMEAIETPINCRICGQETAQNVNGVCKTCWEAGAHLKADLEPEKSSTKLDHQRGKMRVLSDDISYLIMRIEHGSLASIAEHYEVQEEIHELQHILADWDSYIGMEIAKKAAQHDVNGRVSTKSPDKERIRILEHAIKSYMDFMLKPTIAGDEYEAISTYANMLHARTRKLLGEDDDE